ncbi:MAG TPA: hypothetical protein PKZ27_02790 [Rhodocyclaceae bacterium]|nr:hypothetical protein [Terrimesophilobacter sp.]HRO59334.1 hypothetical protein [Burkholderiaceae bacterium]HRP74492.1 hypothetical protein [Rhodocyclaceae bacterium]
MTVNCSTGFRARILGSSSFESIFNGGCIEVYSGAQPMHADMEPSGALVGRITREGLAWSNGNPTNGLLFSRDGHHVTNAPTQAWVLKGQSTGTAGWARLRAVSDSGAMSSTTPRIDMALGPLEGVGDYQVRLPTLALTASTTIPISSWWFVFPPLD